MFRHSVNFGRRLKWSSDSDSSLNSASKTLYALWYSTTPSQNFSVSQTSTVVPWCHREVVFWKFLLEVQKYGTWGSVLLISHPCDTVGKEKPHEKCRKRFLRQIFDPLKCSESAPPGVVSNTSLFLSFAHFWELVLQVILFQTVNRHRFDWPKKIFEILIFWSNSMSFWEFVILCTDVKYWTYGARKPKYDRTQPYCAKIKLTCVLTNDFIYDSTVLSRKLGRWLSIYVNCTPLIWWNRQKCFPNFISWANPWAELRQILIHRSWNYALQPSIGLRSWCSLDSI